MSIEGNSFKNIKRILAYFICLLGKNVLQSLRFLKDFIEAILRKMKFKQLKNV